LTLAGSIAMGSKAKPAAVPEQDPQAPQTLILSSFLLPPEAVSPAASHQLAAHPKEPPFLEGGLPPQLK
jgi:hypothetical protein